MTQLVDLSVSDLLRAFSAPTPTPGGGSASALTGAVGAALLAMVAGMTKTRGGSAAERAVLDRVLPGLLDGRDHLASLVDRDSRAYDAVTAAYRLPKGTDEETRVRRLAIQDAMHGATEVPLDVMRAAHAAAREAIQVASHGNPSASSDVTVALELLDAAFRGAAANVEINVGSLKDAGYVEGVRGEVERLEGSMAEALTLARAALAGILGLVDAQHVHVDREVPVPDVAGITSMSREYVPSTVILRFVFVIVELIGLDRNFQPLGDLHHVGLDGLELLPLRELSRFLDRVFELVVNPVRRPDPPAGVDDQRHDDELQQGFHAPQGAVSESCETVGPSASV